MNGPGRGIQGFPTSRQPIEATLRRADKVLGCLHANFVMRRLLKDIRNTTMQGVIALTPQTDDSGNDNAMRAFRSERMEGLAAKPPGPRGPHKLSEEVMAFVEHTLTRNDSIRPLDIAALVKDAFGVSVHPRSIERALRRRKSRDAHPNAGIGPVQPMANQAGTETTLPLGTSGLLQLRCQTDRTCPTCSTLWLPSRTGACRAPGSVALGATRYAAVTPRCHKALHRARAAKPG